MDRKTTPVFSIAELSAYLDISASTLYKMAQDGKLPGQKVGRRWRFHKKAIDAWLSRYPGKTGEDTGSAEGS